MRLSSIKLAGFKSFVDPTTVTFPSTQNMTAVVGPNGCGKSNIIDAVRWVMGESSAKHLRGEAMTDVIFNGSGGRKPVSQASIELVFDNSEKTLGGEYAAFTDISIRRVVTAEAQSQYYLNGTKCRRRDITDIFLGTGLGPRSYAIIEQGMISRLIESKPEELRVYIEEAAGISKYKERRKETENRMRRTKENLERLTDVREELDRQLARLQRQAQAAKKYEEYKIQERQKTAELQAIQWRELDAKTQQSQTGIREQEVKLESYYAEQSGAARKIEDLRQAFNDSNDQFNEVQGRYYGHGSEIARLEQTIQHQRHRAEELSSELANVEKNFREAKDHHDQDQENILQWTENLEQVETELAIAEEKVEQSTEAQHVIEEQLQQWQTDWETFSDRSAEPKRIAEVQQSKILYVEQTMQRSSERMERLKEERIKLLEQESDESLDSIVEQLQLSQQQLDTWQLESEQLFDNVKKQRDSNHQLSVELDQARGKLQSGKGRYASLEALQQAALGQKNSAVSDWLNAHGMNNTKRLGEKLKVDAGWELATETVLGDYLQAVTVDGLDQVADWVGKLATGSVNFVAEGGVSAVNAAKGVTLLSKVQYPKETLSSLLGGIYCVSSVDEALRMRSGLAANESVITQDGLWFGSNWLRVIKDKDEQSGLLQRQKEIADLKLSIESSEKRVNEIQQQLEANIEKIKHDEMLREKVQKDLQLLSREINELQSNIQASKSKLERNTQRKSEIDTELSEIQSHYEQELESLGESRGALQSAIDEMEQHSSEQQMLQQRREGLNSEIASIRQHARQDRDSHQQLLMKQQQLKTQLSSVKDGIERSKKQLEILSERGETLRASIDASDNPVEDLNVQLQVLLEKRLIVEQELQQARVKVETIETDLRDIEQVKTQAEQQIQETRLVVEQQKLAQQEFLVRSKTLEEALSVAHCNLEEILLGLPADAFEQQWKSELDTIASKITRLGPINLAAIDEFDSQSERKNYLDAQDNDLQEALNTLESAIRRIDKETRQRFSETFEQVNNGLKELFPKVFGGGVAHLELTGDDLLDTGVTIMARPPGKKNSTIHLLSGGEKALTAIALVFSIFQLNPAPFCMLDEVDAPLDDANVGRYAAMVKEMSKKIQFIYITHNKISMEKADQLMGVTMHEPGVSRLVSVDVTEAVELVEA